MLSVHAQAPPGPIQPDPSSVSTTSAPPPPVKRVEPRKTIMGAWKLNRDESDDPRQRSQQRKATDPSGSHGGGGYPSSGPRIGFPGGGMGGGGNRYPSGTQNSEEKQRYQELIDPSVRLDLERKNEKDPIVEMVGDQGRKTIFYTDGNKPAAPPGVGTDVVSAQWDGGKLSSEVSLPKNGSLKRTFELSSDGLQLYENVDLLVGKDKTPSRFRFVYDAVDSGESY